MSTDAPAAYLDFAATTPVRPEVAALLAEWLRRPGNAGSQHAPGRAAAEAVATARAQVAALLVGAAPADIVFTSGATEANNLALQGFLRGMAKRKGAGSGRGAARPPSRDRDVLRAQGRARAAAPTRA